MTLTLEQTTEKINDTHNYRATVPSIREFIDLPKYLDIGDVCCDAVRQTLIDLFDGNYREAVLNWGIGAGKSYLTSIATAQGEAASGPVCPDRGARLAAGGAGSHRRRGGRGMRRLVSSLYRLARLANDLTTLASGNPKRIARRLKNKLVGRKLLPRLWKWPF